MIDIWTRNPAPGVVFRRSTTSRPAVSSAGSGLGGSPRHQGRSPTAGAPLLAMREVVNRRAVALLNNETVTMDGAFVHLNGVELRLRVPGAPSKDVPI